MLFSLSAFALPSMVKLLPLQHYGVYLFGLYVVLLFVYGEIFIHLLIVELTPLHCLEWNNELIESHIYVVFFSGFGGMKITHFLSKEKFIRFIFCLVNLLSSRRKQNQRYCKRIRVSASRSVAKTYLITAFILINVQ